jgi:PAS domain S-box-containing protein
MVDVRTVLGRIRAGLSTRFRPGDGEERDGIETARDGERPGATSRGDPATRPDRSDPFGDGVSRQDSTGGPVVAFDGGRRTARSDGDRESVLTDLYGASRELTAAESTAAIGDTTVETVQDVLGLPLAVLYLDDDGLEPARSTEEAAERLEPAVPDPVVDALGSGDTTVFGAGESGPFGPEVAGLVVGLGEHGVLAAGTTDRERPREATVEYAELFGADVEVAIERTRREALLREREREVRESREKIARLHEAATSMVACRDEIELYELAVEIAEGVLDFDICSLLIDDGDRLVPRASSLSALDDGVEPMGKNEGLAGQTFRAGESFLVEDLRNHERSTPVKSSYRSAISLPVGDYGVFQAVATEPGAFDDRDLEFAELLVSHVGETASRIRAERELQESEAKFREMAENVESVVWMTDPQEGETLYVSPAFETVWGRLPDSVEEDPDVILEWIHEDDRERAAEAFEGTDGYDIQYRIRRPGGEVRWVHDRAFPIGDDQVDRMVGMAADVTERKRREKELERYEAVFETVQDRVYVLDRKGRFRMVNDPFLEMIGYDRETVVGEHVSLILGDDAVERLQRTGSRVLESDDESGRLEVQVETADGDSIPCETDVAVLPAGEEFPGLVGVLRDVSDRKRVEAQLQTERDRLSVLFENVPDPVVEADVDGDGHLRIRSVNPAFESVFGVEAAEVRDDRLAEQVLPPAAEPGEDGFWNCFDETGPFQEEVRRRTDEGIRHFLLRGIPFETAADEGTTTFGIYTDITDQKRRQRQLQVLNRVLRHNLRNDMNKIVGYADLLGAAADDPDQEARAATIQTVADGIVGLSEHVRQLGTALDDEVERNRPIDAVKLVEDLLEPYRARHDVEVRTSLPDAQPIDADARLKLALENLLANAVEHSERETPTVEVSVDQVDADRGEWVDLVVADDGPGIPESERTVFTENPEITDVEHGSGLGLWVVNWVVASLGGELVLSSDRSAGSEITIRLRAADPDDVASLDGRE